jgi:aminopeptidase N
VYAEPSVVEAAASEFSETENMVKACESLFGPYRWDRYDLLILPPAFMYGGMENPRLSFITPTVLAGDRSLVSLIAHELAHSWSGNLVTNATWRDFWLNEGFTVFLERRITDVLYGEKRRDMEDSLGLQSLQRDMRTLEKPLTVLAVDLRGRDPDDGANDIPYEKGRLFLGWLQAKVGRDALDQFLKGYFDHFAFQSIATEQFRDYLLANLLATRPGLVSTAELDEWLYAPGLPRSAVLPSSAGRGMEHVRVAAFPRQHAGATAAREAGRAGRGLQAHQSAQCRDCAQLAIACDSRGLPTGLSKARGISHQHRPAQTRETSL